MDLKYVMTIVDECTRMMEEWKKNLKKFGYDDRRTQEAYYRYLGMERARELVIEIMEEEEA